MGKLEDVDPLSPLQEGILFHSLHAPKSGVYVEQLICALGRPLDAAAFARAWERVVHAVLRTAFVWKRQKRPLQAVQRKPSQSTPKIPDRTLDERPLHIGAIVWGVNLARLAELPLRKCPCARCR